MKWIGSNKYFEEDSNDIMTIINPNSELAEEFTGKTKYIVETANSFLDYYYGELQKII